MPFKIVYNKMRFQIGIRYVVQFYAISDSIYQDEIPNLHKSTCAVLSHLRLYIKMRYQICISQLVQFYTI